MNSRERVMKAVNHERPDRMPIDMGACRATSINAVIYAELKRRVGLHTPTKLYETMQILADIEPEMIEKLHLDVVPLEGNKARWAMMRPDEGRRRRLFCGEEVIFPPDANISEDTEGNWQLATSAGNVFAHMPKNGFYFDYLGKTMANARVDPNAFRPSSTVPDEELEALSRRAEYLYKNTDKAILGWGGGISMLGISWFMGDNITQGALDDWLCMLMVEKETANEMMGRYVEASLAKLKLYHQAVGDYAFAWGIASDDGGTQRGGLINPDLFAEMIKPHYQRVCDWMHRNTKWKTFLHSCGSVYHYLPHWIDAGVDIFNPVQISAANMEPERLMKELGGKVVFWGGGCDSQHVIHEGTPEQVREHVRHNIEVFSKSPGYVFAPVHNIQQTVPVQNVEAMYRAAWEFGQYS